MNIRYNPMNVYNKLYQLQGGRCFYCDMKLENSSWAKGTCPKGYTKDHFFPKSKGHSLVANVVLACRKCNGRKSSAPPSREEVEMFISIWEQIDCFESLQHEAISYYLDVRSVIGFLNRLIGHPIGYVSHN